jgi:ribokinase
MIHVFGSIGRDLVSFVPHLPRPGETVIGAEFHEFPGGKGSNQAVAASRLGARTKLVGNVGADAFGETMIAFLAGEGIDVSAVHRREETPTQLAFIWVDRAGENSIVIIPGANWAWDAGALPLDDIAPDDIVMSQFEIPTEIVAAVFRAAKVRGARTILNPAPARAIPDALLADVDHLIVNELELAALSRFAVDPDDRDSVDAAARRVLVRGPQAVITTLGAVGAVISTAAGCVLAPGHRVHAVDTTGAGDCFIGALASSLAQGGGLESAVRFANRAAAISVTRRGAASSLPTLPEVEGCEAPLP